MKAINIVHVGEIKFTDYLKIKLNSHSSLKYGGQIIVPSQKMQLGTLVDGILTQKERVDENDMQYNYAKKIAATLLAQYPIIDRCQKQYAITGTLTDGYMQLHVKGLIDLYLSKFAIFDIKITEAKLADYEKVISHMGYDNQMWLYSMLSGLKPALIVYSTSEKKARLFPREVKKENEFFRNAMYANGTSKIK